MTPVRDPPPEGGRPRWAASVNARPAACIISLRKQVQRRGGHREHPRLDRFLSLRQVSARMQRRQWDAGTLALGDLLWRDGAEAVHENGDLGLGAAEAAEV